MESLSHSPTKAEALVLPGLCLSCSSEHSMEPSTDLEGLCVCRGAAYHPSFSGKKGKGEVGTPAAPPPLKVCKPSPPGREYKLWANILPSPQDISFNKRPWKCQLV